MSQTLPLATRLLRGLLAAAAQNGKAEVLTLGTNRMLVGRSDQKFDF